MNPPEQFPSGYVPPFSGGFSSPFIEPDGFTHTLWLGGEMELPWPAGRYQVFQVANEIAEACGYLVSHYGDDGLMFAGHGLRHYVKFSSPYVTGHIIDIITDPAAIEREILSAQLRSKIRQLEELRVSLDENKFLLAKEGLHIALFYLMKAESEVRK